MNSEKSLNILLVDDEEIVHQTLAPYLRDLGYTVERADDGNAALALIEKNDYDLALVDVRMPGMDGMALLSKVQEIRPELSAVIMTGHGSMDLAVQALRVGAADFLTKPIKLNELDAVLEKAYRFRELRKKEIRLRETIGEIQALQDEKERGRALIAESQAMKQVKEQVRLAVEANCDTILITGETGTGKEVVAREIHFLAPKGDQRPFIAVSCPALPETLIESELFGHTKGSFTGATADKAGCFELADGGTLFLDEVADLSAAAQAKLLRVLETRTIRRVGGSREIPVSVKVIGATNKPLKELVEQKQFRQDLFYRLNVFSIDLKPLRERKEDLIPLADHFLNSLLARRGIKAGGFSLEAKNALREYSFPGNARELRNIVETAIIKSQFGVILPEHLALSGSLCGNSATHSPSLGGGERGDIMAALEKAKWNRRLAAKNLGMPYSTLRYKLKQLGIE